METQSAAARLSKLPVVRSACGTLASVYTATKCSYPGLTSVCDVLESSVTAACNTVSPVMVKLEPQISIANILACKSLDWLEDSFPVLLSPTEQLVATAQNKMLEIQEAVQHTVMWVVMGTHPPNEGGPQSIVGRAISVANVGLDSALSLSEALVDRVLPPAQGDDGEEKGALLEEGFEVAQAKRSHPERFITLSIKLCWRTCHIVGSKFHSAQDLQAACSTLIWRLQHLAVSAFFFLTQMYRHVQPCDAGSPLIASSDEMLLYPQSVADLCLKSSPNLCMLDNVCDDEECVSR